DLPALMHWTDIVQNDGANRYWMRRPEQHRQNTAARASHEHCRSTAKTEEHADDVAELGHAIVVGMIGLVIGMAAAPGINGDHVPLRRTPLQSRSQFVEIGGRARQAREAYNRHAGTGAIAVCAHMES